MAEELSKLEIFKPRIYLFLFLIVISLNISSATTFLNIYLQEDGTALLLGETDSTNISLPEGISISSGKIIGSTDKLTSKTDSSWIFELSLPNSEINLILPENSIIKESSSSEISSENNRILLYSSDFIKVRYELEKNNSLVYIILIPIIIILLITIYLLFLSKKKDPKIKPVKKNKKDKLDYITNLLHERQNQIILLLKQNKKIKMSKLRKLSGIPKASFSRHIQELEKKNLIKREGDGKNKIISLK